MQRPIPTWESTASSSPASGFGVAGLFAGVFVAASHPVQFALAALVLIGAGLAVRTVWRRALTRGFAVPWRGARVFVDQSRADASADDGTQWSLTVAVVEES